ncbi:M23 family metallopeptidase [Gorillibacterium sp. CAU 1737]|uniref:M23 family metallopeptidase n=1 Tax=Gorillibacterium sp. CAU 1737 TaxID=3140362 RepID=UPI003260343B
MRRSSSPDRSGEGRNVRSYGKRKENEGHEERSLREQWDGWGGIWEDKAARERSSWTDDDDRRAVPIQERLRTNLLQEEGYPDMEERVELDPEQLWREKEKSLFRPGAGSLWHDDGRGPDREKGGVLRTLRLQLAASLLLFGGIWAVFHTPASQAEPARHWVRQVMTSEWNFTAVSDWYVRQFGTLPSFLPAFHEEQKATEAATNRTEPLVLPVQGALTNEFSSSSPWVELTAPVGAGVSAIDAGLVIYTGNEGEQGTITLQHTGGLESTYIGLEGVPLKKGDWVKRGEVIGRMERDPSTGQGLLRFSIRKDSQYVDPVEWVPFD